MNEKTLLPSDYLADALASALTGFSSIETRGRVLADRSLSRLLKRDWPRSLDEWEARMPS